MSFGFVNTNQITLETFSSDTAPSEFVNKLSKLSEDTNGHDTYIHTDNNKVQYVDPVPYINSLRSVQDKLSLLMDECEKKKDVFERSTKKRENDHFTNVITQSTRAVDLKSKFNDLLLTVEKLNTSKIDPLGEKLKKASTLKDNASNISFLLKCYNRFYINSEPPIELSTDRQRANTFETARILSQLLKLSSKLASDAKLPNAENAHTLILEFATTFESDQLKSFNTYYQSKNFARLQNITKTLFIYNNGINIVDFFVGGHPIFVQMQDNVKQPVSDSYWKTLRNPTSVDYSLDHVSAELLEAVRETILSEIDSITTIFQENAKQALISLIIKLVDNIVKPRMKLLLTTATSQSTLSYLRILHLFYNGITQMAFAQLRSVLLDKSIDFGFEFDKIYNSLFNEHLKENSYFTLEKENLESLIDSLLGPFEDANRDAIKEKKLTMKIEKVKEDEILEEQSQELEGVHSHEDENPYEASSPTLANAKSKAPNSSAHSNIDLYLPDSRILRDKLRSARNYVPNSQKFKKMTGISSFIKSNEKYSLFDRYKSSYGTTSTNATELFGNSVTEDLVAPQSKSALSLKVTQSIYKLVLEALTRSIELMPSQISLHSVELFKLMLYKVGPSYIAVGLESLYDTYVDSQLKNKSVFGRGATTDIDLSFLSQFYTIFVQLYLLSTVVKKSFYPLVSSEHDTNFISHSFNLFLQDVEIGVNVTVNDLVGIVQERINLILSKQPVNDYMVVSESDRTPTCDSVVAFLENILNSALEELSFDPVLKLRFVNKISSYFLSMLILHLSHLKVSMNGFTLLTHDLAQYILIFNNIKIDNTESLDLYADEEGSRNAKGDNDNKWVKEQLDQIQSAFKILNELPGLYTCQPESLKEFCSEGKLNELKKSVIRGYISNREDFQTWFLSNI